MTGISMGVTVMTGGKDIRIRDIRLNTAIIGSGAAGYNAAVRLYDLGLKDIAVFTEGREMGTSRNTGSDKQTYYKLSLEGGDADSVLDMARTYFEGGCMHGDIALVEAALSARSFFNLVEAGVAFPHNRYGEYVGYRTDHDPKKRATSAGPLTSRYMTECLEEQAINRGIRIYDGFLAVKILTAFDGPGRKAYGFFALDSKASEPGKPAFLFVNCTNIILATGGPAGMYERSVYPESQNGASGMAFLAGCRGVNLTESQFGIASVKFRWNLSGTYQQVLPRYISTDRSGGDEKEFLEGCFSGPGKMLDSVFLKGYQWPFDPRKIKDEGSSLIDLLVYNETKLKGRRAWVDYTRNPAADNGRLDFSLLGSEAFDYLRRSDALFGSPVDRLGKMNPPAVELYKNNGIDLRNEPLEIDVCAQHNNGGLVGNIWYESNIKNIFPVGEANGAFGVYRPGGSALNSTQAGSLRAAQYIAANCNEPPALFDNFENEKDSLIRFVESVLKDKADGIPAGSLDTRAKSRMTMHGAFIRNISGTEHALCECARDLSGFEERVVPDEDGGLETVFKAYNNLISQFVYLGAIKEYLKRNGVSRGSYLVTDDNGMMASWSLPEAFRYIGGDDMLRDKVNEVGLVSENGSYRLISEWISVRGIPVLENWFENVWNDFRGKKIYK